MTRPSVLRPAHRGLVIVALCGAATVVVGCLPPEPADPRITRIQELEDRVEMQGRELAAKDRLLAELSRRIQTLSNLNEDQRRDHLVQVASIEVERLSGGYDDDADGVDDGVVVYLRLRDADGDTIKQGGLAQVELYDLSAPQGRKQVGGSDVPAEALSKLWYGKLMTSHYTIHVPWTTGSPPAGRLITVVVRFTDLLTGRVFEAQRVVEIAGNERTVQGDPGPPSE